MVMSDYESAARERVIDSTMRPQHNSGWEGGVTPRSCFFRISAMPITLIGGWRREGLVKGAQIMRHGYLPLTLMFIICSPSLAKSQTPDRGTVTLAIRHDQTSGRLIEKWAEFNLKRGSVGEGPGDDWDLDYGFLAINNEDWFEVSHAKGKRSVMKDLGELNLSDQYKVPVLTPLPELAEGESRNITIDSGGDTHRGWAATTQIFAKVIIGHLYAIHVKDEHSDFYALFRVEEHQQRDHCT